MAKSTISNRITRCRHTNIPMIISNHFHNTPAINQSMEHPIFAVKASKLEQLMTDHIRDKHKLSRPEQYLVCLSYLVNCGLVDTRKFPLTLVVGEDSKEFVKSRMMTMLPDMLFQINNAIKNDIPLPIYAVSVENQTSGEQMKDYLLTLREALDDSTCKRTGFHRNEDELTTNEFMELLTLADNTFTKRPPKTITKMFITLVSPQCNERMLDMLRKWMYSKELAAADIEVIKKAVDWVVINVRTYDEWQSEEIKRRAIRHFTNLINKYEDKVSSHDYMFEVMAEVDALDNADSTPPAKTKSTVKLPSSFKKKLLDMRTRK